MFEERRSNNKLLTAFAVFGVVGVVALVGVIAHEAGQASVDTQNLMGYNGSDEYEHLFRSWMKHYNRKYENFGEYLNRFNIFVNNARLIEHHNTNGNTYTLALNHFADLSQAEFKQYYLGLDATREEKNYVTLDDSTAADSVDWTTKGAVTAVKNQGQCGSCWSFSATGAMEGLNFIKNGDLKSFSEQQLVDCSGSYGNQGCNGGLMDSAFQYVEKYGIELESDYPYTAQDGTCSYDASKVAFTITGFTDVTPKNAAQMKSAITLQPVAIAIEADQFAFQYYSGGVMTGSCGTALDHGVLAVGYGTDGAQAFWKVKNSWGGSWGESGYIRIERTDDNSAQKCGILAQPSYPTA